MARPDLLDRMHAELLQSARAWSAGELAERFLKLSSQGPLPDRLIRSLLARDGRFVEGPEGSWGARAPLAAPLAGGSYLLAWLETGESPHVASWRLHVRPLEEDDAFRVADPGPGEEPLTAAGPAAWVRARTRWSGRRLATLQPGPVARFLQWVSRSHALPEWSEPLDLLVLARLALAQEGVPAAETLRSARPDALAARWSLGPVAETSAGAPLVALGRVCERLLERYGELTEEEALALADAALGTRPVDFEAFAFSRAEIDALPETSGIYRFYGEADRLLYIGKAVRLRRRVSSYFRPLPPEAGKRAELLRQIRRFEADPLPSELEALLLESRGIRTYRPPWNVQVGVQEPETLPPDWWWPLVFVPPGEDPELATVVFLRGADQGWLFHLPREEEPGLGAELGAWLDAEMQGRTSTSRSPLAGALPLESPEARLALRYYLRERERQDRADAVHFAHGAELASAILRLAAQSAPLAPPADHRPPTDASRGPGVI